MHKNIHGQVGFDIPAIICTVIFIHYPRLCIYYVYLFFCEHAAAGWSVVKLYCSTAAPRISGAKNPALLGTAGGCRNAGLDELCGETELQYRPMVIR